MKQSTKRLVSSFFALLFLVAAFVVFFNFIRPAYESLRTVRSEELSRRVFTESQQKVITQMQSLLGTYEGEGEVQQAVSAALPLSPSVGEALAQLQGLMTMNNLFPQSFAVTTPGVQNLPAAAPAGGGGAAGKEKQPPLVRPIGALTFQARFTGTYENFKAFLKGLETNVRILNVRSLSFQPTGKSTQDNYAYDLTVVAYYQTQ